MILCSFSQHLRESASVLMPGHPPTPPRPPAPPTRREFFRDSARWSALAVLGAAGAVLAARGGPLIGKICPGAGTCGRCPLQPRCPSPTAANPKSP
jgi:hypothetical protein